MSSQRFQDVYKLSPTQEGMLFHALMGDAGSAYIEQISLDCVGAIDVELMERSFNALLERYDILRTVFQHQDLKHPLQIVLRRRVMKIHFQDISGMEPTAQLNFLEDYKLSVRRKGFDLSRDLLLKIALFKTGSDTHTLIWSSHHIVMDGWCLGILFKDLLTLYTSFKTGVPHGLPPVTPYKKYIQWLDTQKPAEANGFWKEYLAGYGQKTGFLPEDQESDNGDYNLKEYFWLASDELSHGLQEAASELQVTVNTIFQAVWGLLLHYYNFSSDAVFGTVVSGRPSGIPGIETMVGLFVNTVPTRVQTHEGQTFADLIQVLHRDSSAAKPYEFVPLAETQAHTPLRENLFDHLVSFQNFPIQEEIKQFGNESAGPGFSIGNVHVHEQTHYNLNALVGFAGNLTVNFNYNARVYPDAAIRQMAAGLERLLIQVKNDCRQPVHNLHIIGKEEKEEFLSDLNRHAPDFPARKTLPDLFREAVARYSDHTALVNGYAPDHAAGEMTYHQLDQAASSVASYLQDKGVGPDCIVALRFHRSFEMLAGIFGVLLAGGAYLPIDPAYPSQRALYMLNDSCARLLLGGDDLDHRELASIDRLEIIPFSEAVKQGGGAEPRPTCLAPSHLAYVIYTSGTTGRPKGSLLQHDNVVSLLFHKSFPYEFSHHDVWPLFHSYCFDVSVWEIFCSLLNGGRLVVISAEMTRDPGQFLEILSRQRMTVLNQTPSSFYNIAAYSLEYEDLDLCLRYVIFAGEALKPSRLEDWRRRFPRVRFINMYGITETTVHVTFKEIQDADIHGDSKSVGVPLETLKVMIGDRNLHPLPPGVPGEMLVAGAGVCRGYLNRPELTAEKFVKNPRLYRSGDKGRWTMAGELEYYGRIDGQVKIRGYRIEPQEIEEVLRRHPAVDDALVRVMSGHDHDLRLCAYVIPGEELDALRSYAAEKLPSYMIPSYFVPLPAFPLTSNGKLDVAALPAPLEHAPEPVSEPTSPEEKKLAQVWAQVLEIEPAKIGSDSDFFKLGGHSLKITRLAALIHKEFGVKIPLPKLFNRPTIARQAAYITGKDGEQTFLSIQPAEKRDLYPCSSAQRRLLFLHQMEPETVFYNIPCAMMVERPLNLKRLRDVFTALLKRHESFRTSFLFDGKSELSQRIHDTVDFTLESFSYNDQADDVSRLIQRFIRPFDLASPPLLRVGTAQIGENSYLLMIDMHHVIADGVSMSILVREFMTLYGGGQLPPLSLQYKDYSLWQNSEDYRKEQTVQKKFWQSQFADHVPVLELPLDHPRPLFQSFAGNNYTFQSPGHIIEPLLATASSVKATPFMAFLSVFYILLSKLGGQEDIVVGTPVSGRVHADLDNIVGMFVNTLPLRNEPLGSKLFTQFLEEVRDNTIACFDNQQFPFEEMVECLEVERDTSRNPLFDVVFSMQNLDDVGNGMPPGGFTAGDFAARPITFESTISKFDLTLSTRLFDDGATFTVEYCTALFNEESIVRFAGYFLEALSAVTQQPHIRLDDIDIMTEEEKKQVLVEFNRTQSHCPDHHSIPELFRLIVERDPQHVALLNGYSGCDDPQVMTYGELDRLTDRVATCLRNKGVGPDVIVGLRFHRSFEMIAGIFGILKAGGAYLPIDPSFPPHRAIYMLSDCGAGLLLGGDDLDHQALIGDGGLEVIPFSAATREPSGPFSVPSGLTPDHLAYVMYTSGTTGHPKGILIVQRNVVRLVMASDNLTFTPGDRVSQLANVAFDGSVFEIFGAVLNGSTLVVLPGEILPELENLADIIVRHKVSISFFTTALFNALVDLCPHKLAAMKKIFFGGEQASADHCRRALVHTGPGVLVNLYGPTEITVFATYYPVDRVEENAGSIPIGTPVVNTSVYILSKGLRPLPVGVIGEIYIGGTGVARGYLNNERLTAERFIDNPFQPGDRLYRSGDLGRFLPGGAIEFFGRVDDQVKIRGFRIELSEIQHCLKNIPGVTDAVVLEKKDAVGESYLCAYVVGEAPVERETIQVFLQERLPAFMIPARFIDVPRIPLTSNGKLDRRKLPEPEMATGNGEAFVPPRHDNEKKLAVVWSHILGIDVTKIGIHSDFFQLGGHSLKVTRLSVLIHKELNVKIPLPELFNRPTISLQAEYISEKDEAETFVAIQPAEKRDFYPCSSAQRRLLFLHRMEPESVVYNIPCAMIVERPLNPVRLRDLFNALIERHESFRTSFLFKDGTELLQRIHDTVDFTVESFSKKDEADDMSPLVHSFIRPFDLTVPPLLRVGTAPIGENSYLLMMDMHHVIADGVSMSMLVREFMTLYGGGQLPPLSLQYKDYSLWQTSEVYRKEQTLQKRFWQSQFADHVPVLDLPLDHPRPHVQSFAGDNYTFQAPAHTIEPLLATASSVKATPFMAFLSVFYILLSKLGGQEDIVVGTPVSGRGHADFYNIVGMFVNTLPLRNEPVGSKLFTQFLEEVRDNTIACFDNQQFPFEEMVECLSVERDTSRNPLFDVVFSMQNIDDGDIEMPAEGFTAGDFAARPLTFDGTVSKFDLSLAARLSDDGATFSVEYCTALFNEESIVRFAGYFLRALSTVAQHPDIHLEEIDMMTEEEKAWVLELCNTPIASFPHQETIHRLFARRAKTSPQSIAITGPGGECLTYRELDDRSRRLAFELRRNGVTSDSIVGVMTDRSPFMIVAILGTLKAGGGYMPIDPNYPEERISYMLADSGAGLLVTQEDLPRQRELSIDKVYDGQLNGGFDPGAFEDADNGPEDLAYVIYTSGTTGKPKGSLIQHNNVVSLMFHEQYPFAFSHDDVWTLFHSYCFDFSVWEMYGALLYGGRLVMVSSEDARDPGNFLRLLERERVTVLNQTPSAFYNVSAQSRYMETLDLYLRYIIFGGEALQPSRLEYWRERFRTIRFVNMYGITETTVHVTFNEIDDEAIRLNSPSIGNPLSTLNVLIAGRDSKLVPVGVPGEILVSGAGLCRGYLNRPELTAEKFPGEPRFYRSGDKGRLTASGKLEYLGRIDQQVKIRGYRIEPQEIEAVLRRHNEVDDALVRVLVGEDGDRRLCAYVIPGHHMDSVRGFLEKNLPSYMLPSYFVPLQAFPLTSNGKLDLQALPEPLQVVDHGSRTFEDAVEESIAGIFARILDVDMAAIGRDSGFFDLGGHSLKAVSLANDIHRELNVKLPIHTIFQASTVSQLAREIRVREQSRLAAITPLERREYYELSYTQKRMWVLQSRAPQSAAFNMPDQIGFDRPLDVGLVKRAFRLLALRHEALRTYLKEVNGVAMQVVLSEVEIPVEYLDLSGLSSDKLQERLDEVMQFESETGFDLYRAPLIRARVIQIGANDWHILFNIHHLMSDGWSMEVLKGDFQAIYQALESGTEPLLETVEIQYKDYAHWHNRHLEDEGRLAEVLAFYRKHLEGSLPVLNLPYDSSPNQLTSRSGSAYRFVLSAEATEKLNQLARDRNCSYYMVMLAAVNLLLSQLRQQDDIIIGLPGAAREHPGLRQTVGLFVNTLVLRTRLDREVSFLDLLERVKRDTMKVLEYQGFPLELVVDQLGIDYPKFSMFFNMLNMADNSETLPDHQSFHLMDVQDAKFDLEFYIKEYQNGTAILASYFRQLFLPETIEKISARFVAILEQIAADPTLPLKEYRGVKKKMKILKKKLPR